MIQLPGDPAAPSLPPAQPDPLPVDAPDVTGGGQPLEGADEPVQVAGVAAAIRGIVEKFGGVFRKGSKAPANPAAPAAAAPPPPPPPVAKPAPSSAPAPKPAPGPADAAVAAKVPDEAFARGVASEMRAKQPSVPPAEPKRTEWRNFRSDKLDTTDKIKALIDDVAERHGGHLEARRGVVSNAQTAQEAKEYGLDELLTRKPSEAWNAAQLSAGREILLELSARIQKAAQAIDTGKATAEDMLAFRMMLGQHAAVQETLQGAVAEAGRALQIMRTVSAAGGRLRSKQVLETLDNLGGEAAARKLAETVVATGGNPAKLARIAKKAWWEKSLDILNEIRINGMLSGAVTHIVNTGSNSLTALMQPPERFVAGAIGKMHGGPRVEMDESVAMLYGLMNGWQDAFRAAGKVARTGEPLDAVTKLEAADRAAITSAKLGIDEASATGKAVDLFGEFIRLPGRAMMAEDEFFKTIGRRMEIHAQAVRRAHAEGLDGQAWTDRVNDLVNDPPEDILDAADAAAKYLTFQESLAGGGLLERMGQTVGVIQQHPLGKVVFPWRRAPINVARVALERTPLAPATAKFWRAMAKGGPEGDLALARFTLGTVASILVAMQAETGKITGSGPANRRVRDAMMASGWRPYSILIGGTYYPYNRLDPLGTVIGAAADAQDTLRFADDEATASGVTSAVIAGFADSMASKTFVQGLSELLDVFGDPDNEKKVGTYMAKQGLTFMPYSGLSNFLRQVTDDTARETRAGDALTLTMNLFKSRVPGMSHELPPKLGLWGEPVIPEAGVLSPVKWATGKRDLATQEVIGNRVAIGKTSPRISVPLGAGRAGHIDLLAVDKSGELFNFYQQLAGQLAHEKVTELVNSASWESEDPDQPYVPVRGQSGLQARKIKKAFEDARAEAIRVLVQERPEVSEAAALAFEIGAPPNTLPLPAHMLENPAP